MSSDVVKNQARYKLLFYKDLSLENIKAKFLVKDWKNRLWGVVGDEGAGIFKGDLSDFINLTGLEENIVNLEFLSQKNVFFLQSGNDLLALDFKGNLWQRYPIPVKNFSLTLNRFVVISPYAASCVEVYNLAGGKEWEFEKKFVGEKLGLAVKSLFNNLLDEEEESIPIDGRIIFLKGIGKFFTCVLDSGALHVFSESGKQVSVYMAPERIDLFGVSGSPFTSKLFLVGRHGLDFIDFLEKRPLWENPYFFENEIRFFDSDFKLERIAILDEKNYFYYLTSKGEELFQVKIDEEVKDIKLSSSGEYVYFLLEDKIKLFKIIEHGEEYADEFSFLDVEEKEAKVDLEEEQLVENGSVEIVDTLEIAPDVRVDDLLDHSGDVEILSDTKIDLEVDYLEDTVLNLEEKEEELPEKASVGEEVKPKDILPLANVYFFQTDYANNFALYATDKGYGVYNLSRKVDIFFQNIESRPSFSFPLYGRRFYAYFPEENLLKVYSIIGGLLFQGRVEQFSWLFPSLQGEEVLVLLDNKRRLVKVDIEQETKKWEVTFDREVVSIDADYKLSKIIVSLGKEVFVLDGERGEKVVRKSFSEEANFVDVNGSGLAFGLSFPSRFTYLNYGKKLIKDFFPFSYPYKSKISLNGEVGVFWKENKLKILSFEKGEFIFEKDWEENILDIELSLKGESIVLVGEQNIYWKKQDQNIKIFSRNFHQFFHLQSQGKLLYFICPDKVEIVE